MTHLALRRLLAVPHGVAPHRPPGSFRWHSDAPGFTQEPIYDFPPHTAPLGAAAGAEMAEPDARSNRPAASRQLLRCAGASSDPAPAPAPSTILRRPRLPRLDGTGAAQRVEEVFRECCGTTETWPLRAAPAAPATFTVLKFPVFPGPSPQQQQDYATGDSEAQWRNTMTVEKACRAPTVPACDAPGTLPRPPAPPRDSAEMWSEYTAAVQQWEQLRLRVLLMQRQLLDWRWRLNQAEWLAFKEWSDFMAALSAAVVIVAVLRYGVRQVDENLDALPPRLPDGVARRSQSISLPTTPMRAPRHGGGIEKRTLTKHEADAAPPFLDHSWLTSSAPHADLPPFLISCPLCLSVCLSVILIFIYYCLAFGKISCSLLCGGDGSQHSCRTYPLPTQHKAFARPSLLRVPRPWGAEAIQKGRTDLGIMLPAVMPVCHTDGTAWLATPESFWQSKSAAVRCQHQDCGQAFTFFTSKINCHRCGIVLCRDCTAKRVMEGLFGNGEVPVCRRCDIIIRGVMERRHRAAMKRRAETYVAPFFPTKSAASAPPAPPAPEGSTLSGAMAAISAATSGAAAVLLATAVGSDDSDSDAAPHEREAEAAVSGMLRAMLQEEIERSRILQQTYQTDVEALVNEKQELSREAEELRRRLADVQAGCVVVDTHPGSASAPPVPAAAEAERRQLREAMERLQTALKCEKAKRAELESQLRESLSRSPTRGECALPLEQQPSMGRAASPEPRPTGSPSTNTAQLSTLSWDEVRALIPRIPLTGPSGRLDDRSATPEDREAQLALWAEELFEKAEMLERMLTHTRTYERELHEFADRLRRRSTQLMELHLPLLREEHVLLLGEEADNSRLSLDDFDAHPRAFIRKLICDAPHRRDDGGPKKTAGASPSPRCRMPPVPLLPPLPPPSRFWIGGTEHSSCLVCFHVTLPFFLGYRARVGYLSDTATHYVTRSSPEPAAGAFIAAFYSISGRSPEFIPALFRSDSVPPYHPRFDCVQGLLYPSGFFWQGMHLTKEQYAHCLACPLFLPTCRLFDSDELERFTNTKFWVPLALRTPLTAYWLVRGATDADRLVFPPLLFIVSCSFIHLQLALCLLCGEQRSDLRMVTPNEGEQTQDLERTSVRSASLQKCLPRPIKVNAYGESSSPTSPTSSPFLCLDCLAKARCIRRALRPQLEPQDTHRIQFIRRPSTTMVAHSTPESGGGHRPAKDIPINPSLSTVALEALEHRYVEVVRELASEPQLEPFRNEYEKVHRLLQKSYDGEKRLIGKIKELRDELNTHSTKIDTAVQLSQEDEDTIGTLRMEIEKAWAMADTAHQREKESRETIQVLKQQVQDLDALVSQSAGLTMGQEAYLRDLINTKRQLEDEHLLLSSRVAHLGQEHKEYLKKLRQVQAEETAVRDDFNRRLAAYQALLSDLETQQKERAMKEQSVREYRTTTEKHVVELEKKRVQTESYLQEEVRLKKEAVDLTDEVQALLRQVEDLQHKFKTEADRLSYVEQQNLELKREIPKKQAVLKEKQVELAKEKKNLKAAEHQARTQQGELEQLVAERDKLILDSNDYSSQIDKMLEIVALREKEVQAVEGELQKAMHGKSSTLLENAAKENERTALEGERILEEGKRRSAAQELAAMLTESEKMRKHVFELEQIHQKELTAAQNFMLEYHKTLDQIRSKRSDAKKLRDVFAAHEKKQKVQQELLERVSSDRNRTEKQLRETEADWKELLEKHAGKLGDIEQMKSDLVAKEGMLCRLHTVSKQIHRDTACTEQRASHLKEDCLHANTRIQVLNEEAHQLNQVIANCDAEKLRQDMRLKSITNERNVLATQLIRRNEELRLLYDKIQLQQSMLEKGALDYASKVGEIVDAREQLLETRLRCRLVLVRLRYMERLRKKELSGNKVLIHERARVRALTEELSKPVNVHRWRRLEGSKPALLDDIAKVQMLQKKLLSKCDECKRKRLEIRDKDREYGELRRRLARMPGPEAAEDLTLYHENIEKRHEQIDIMTSEREGIEQHAEVLAEEKRQLSEELWEVTSKYMKAKTRNDLLLRERRTMRQTWGALTPAAHAAIYQKANQEKRSSSANDSQGVTRLSSGSKLPRERLMETEDALLQALTAGTKAPVYPLTKPKNLKTYVGGGFAFTR
eukprot:gene8590-6030_t